MKQHLPNCPSKPGLMIIILLCFLGFSRTAFGQLQWSSYNTSGNLVAANVASGGDSTYGGSATFTVPAGTELIFVTGTFVPVGLPAGSSSDLVDFTMSASGGLYPQYSGRLFGMGLLNNPGTASALNDTGYWTDFNTGNPDFELFYQPGTLSSFFQYNSTYKLGSGHTSAGNPTNNINYGMQFQLNMNSGATSVSIGTGDGSFAVAGAALTNGNGSVNQLSYSSAVALTTLPTTNFNQFAFMFDNLSAGSVAVTLSGVTLVPANPVLTSQPLNTGGSPGGNYSFSVTLNSFSAGPLSYQWYMTNGVTTNLLANGVTGTGSTISGATNATLNIDNGQVGDSGGYFVVVTNNYGAVTSSIAGLFVSSTPFAPFIDSVSPTNAVVAAGNGTNITVVTVGVPTPTVYWYDNNSNLLQSGAGTTLTLSDLQPADSGIYTVVSSNSVGSVLTNFTVTVDTPPGILQGPTNLLLNLGQPASFSVTAGGNPAPTYQWYDNGHAISGATGPSYSIAGVVYTNIGTYTVVLSNSVGTVTSAGAVLAIYSGMSGTPASPANSAAGICVDSLLNITFNQPVSVGNTGNINIYDSANTNTPVDTLSFSSGNLQLRSVGGVMLNTYNVLINGQTAAIYPHSDVLAANQTYYVTIDPGVFVDTNGAYFAGINNTTTWQFTTKATGPANPTNLVVAANGSADFCTVQGAIESVAPSNTTPTTINIENGTYTEVDRVNGKTNLTFIGQNRYQTIIAYPNNNNINGSTTTRPMFGVNESSAITIENLTLTNSTPLGGSQAEALLGNYVKQLIVLDCNLDSYQDTVLINQSGDQAYIQDSYIQGNTDYIWGSGTLYVTNTVCMDLTSGSHLTQARTPEYTNGFAFVNCRILGANSTCTNCDLGRDAGSSGNTPNYPYGQVAYIDCTMDTNVIIPPGFILGSGSTQGPDTANLRFWEYGSVDTNGNPVYTGARVPWCTELDGATATNDVQNIQVWLYGWQPQVAPNITSQPVGQTVGAGQNVTLAVGASGIPAPVYQWLFNGTNLIGQTGATLTINNASALNAGTYSVIVSNNVGGVLSSNVVLTVTPPTTPAALATPVISAGMVQFSLTGPDGSAGFGYRVWATTNIDLSPVTNTWTLLTNGVFGFGPSIITDTPNGLPQRFYLITVP